MVSQTSCSSANEQLIKTCAMYTLEYYLAVKKIEITSFARKWIELEKFLLSEATQTQENRCHMSFVYGAS